MMPSRSRIDRSRRTLVSRERQPEECLRNSASVATRDVRSMSGWRCLSPNGVFVFQVSAKRCPVEVPAHVTQIVALEPVPDDELRLQGSGVFSENSPIGGGGPVPSIPRLSVAGKCGADTTGDRCLARHASTVSERVAKKRNLQWRLSMQSTRIVEPVFVGIVDGVLAGLVTVHRRRHRDSSEHRKHAPGRSRDHQLAASRHGRHGVDALRAEIAHDCDSRPEVYSPAGFACRIQPDLQCRIQPESPKSTDP